MITTIEEIKELVSNQSGKTETFYLFPLEETIWDQGETIETQDYSKELDRGYINNYLDFVSSHESKDVGCISWWDGSNTIERYCDYSEIEVLGLVSLKDICVSEKGTYRQWESFFYDVENDNVYVQYTDNCQQRMIQKLILVAS
tara:strand:+ start:396 stop:827 length:432 start_codon:yes stop_codon:yes gene_type:complete